MQRLLGVTLIALYLTVQGNFSSLLAQPPNIQTSRPYVTTISPASDVEPERESGLYVAAENLVIPPEGQALTCFSFMLSHLRFFEAVARACRIPLPERLADFIARGVELGEGRFEALYGVEAQSRLRREVDQSLARVDGDALGSSCADASRRLAATEEQLFSTAGGQSAVDGLLRKLGTMIGRSVPNSFDCE
jgi:hypothetical protein